MTMPNFFIVGAQKAGTTSLYHYLDQHPQIYMSPIKEPCYFSDEIRFENFSDEIRRPSTLDAFLAGPITGKRFGGPVTGGRITCVSSRARKGRSPSEKQASSICGHRPLQG